VSIRLGLRTWTEGGGGDSFFFSAAVGNGVRLHELILVVTFLALERHTSRPCAVALQGPIGKGVSRDVVERCRGSRVSSGCVRGLFQLGEKRRHLVAGVGIRLSGH